MNFLAIGRQAKHPQHIILADLAGSPEANGWLRSIFVDSAVVPATWRLKVENISDRDSEVCIAVWSDAVK